MSIVGQRGVPNGLLIVGRMYRARLDSVVTVVDADHLAGRMAADDGEGGLSSAIPGAAARSQLACADVVLLNKVARFPGIRMLV